MIFSKHLLSRFALEGGKHKALFFIDAEYILHRPFTQVADAIEKYDGSVVQLFQVVKNLLHVFILLQAINEFKQILCFLVPKLNGIHWYPFQL